MNSLPPLSLPRFHVNALAPAPKDRNLLVGERGNEGAFDAELEAQLAQTEDEAEEAVEAVEVAPAPIQPEIDTGTILQSLEAQLDGLQQVAAARAAELTRDFIASAFPRLAEAFLAEEVMRELETTAPPAIEKVVLKVPTQFGVSFQNAVQASPRLSEICELQMLDAAEEIYVDADWQTGGLQFDVQRFVESSLARMSGPESV
ncbi:MAG: hypothetical protein AAFQ24_03090 [Pseudomonadota bacterium]